MNRHKLLFRILAALGITVLLIYAVFPESVDNFFLYISDERKIEATAFRLRLKWDQYILDRKINAWRACKESSDCIPIVFRCGIYAVNEASLKEAREFYRRKSAISNCRLSPEPQLQQYEILCEQKLCTAKYKSETEH